MVGNVRNSVRFRGEQTLGLQNLLCFTRTSIQSNWNQVSKEYGDVEQLLSARIYFKKADEAIIIHWIYTPDFCPSSPG